MSTGSILLADIIPSFVIKMMAPFLPYNAKIRVFISCIASAISFLIVGTASSKRMAIFGVAITSFASGLGEPTFLAHSTNFDKNAISAWSSGTGAAGIVGAISYSFMKQIGISSYETMLLMIVVPIIELLVFTLVLSRAQTAVQNSDISVRNDDDDENEPLIIYSNANIPQPTWIQKMDFLPHLMIYFIPLTLVYFFEYFINQGLVKMLIIFYFTNF
jgi:battenin